MKRYSVIFSPKALRDLHKLRTYFAQRFDHPSAEKFANQILMDCEAFAVAPHRGTLVSGRTERYRLTGIAKGKVAVLFEVNAEEVKILALRYGGDH